MTHKIMTLRQYTDSEDRRAAEHFDVPLAEVRTSIPRRRRELEWREYVLAEFSHGATITTRIWRAIDPDLRRRILRTPRALRDDALTRDLLSKEDKP